MSSFNRVILSGNITRDIEVRTVGSNDTSVTDIGLAVNNRVKKGDSWEDEPCFVDVTLWGKNAEIVDQYLHKGSSVMIEGYLKLDQWTNAEGQNRSKLRVQGERVILPNKAPVEAGAGASSGGSGGGGDGDLPF